MAKSFTDTERDAIRENLKNICKKNWTQNGYKKTSVEVMCKDAGISKGAFYLFFESKEALFGLVITELQDEIYDTIIQNMQKAPGVSGIMQALKDIYRIYDKNGFLQQSDSEDYKAFIGKLNAAQRRRIEDSERRNADVFIADQPITQSKERILSVIYSLLMTMKNKNVLPDNHIDVFDFMVDRIIPKMYMEVLA